MSQPVGFGVIGANSFVANAAVIPAIEDAPNATLVATASRSSGVPQRWRGTDVGSYEAVLEHPNVEAVYIPLPNGMHREWTEKAAAAGKHVLCEKPLAADAATARAMADACADAGVLLAEAWMTPFHRRYRQALDLARSGRIGTVDKIESHFTFTIGPEAAANYRWDPDQGGGALLDVGIYCLGPIVELFDARPSEVRTAQLTTDRDVDATTWSELTWPDGHSAVIECSFADDETQTLELRGTNGQIRIGADAFTAGPLDTDVSIESQGTTSVETLAGNDSYQSMVEAFATAVRRDAEWPRPVERSIEMLELIQRIKEAAPRAPHA